MYMTMIVTFWQLKLNPNCPGDFLLRVSMDAHAQSIVKFVNPG